MCFAFNGDVIDLRQRFQNRNDAEFLSAKDRQAARFAFS